MKMACFLFVFAACGALSLGIIFADPPPGQTSSENPSPGNPPANPTQASPTKAKGDQTNVSGIPTNGTGDEARNKSPQPDTDNHTPKKPLQTAQTKTPSPKPSLDNAPPSAAALTQTTSIAKTVLPANKPASSSVQPIKPPLNGGTASLGANMFRKPTGVTASLGGLNASSVKTGTAGINGAGMQRTTTR